MTLLPHLSLSHFFFFLWLSWMSLSQSHSLTFLLSFSLSPCFGSTSLSHLPSMSVLQNSSQLTHPLWRHKPPRLQLSPSRTTSTSVIQAQDRTGASQTPLNLINQVADEDEHIISRECLIHSTSWNRRQNLHLAWAGMCAQHWICHLEQTVPVALLHLGDLMALFSWLSIHPSCTAYRTPAYSLWPTST